MSYQQVSHALRNVHGSRPVPKKSGMGVGTIVLLLGILFTAFGAASADDQQIDQAAVESASAGSDFDQRLDEVLRKPVPDGIEDLRIIETRVKELTDTVIAATVGVRIGNAQGSGVIISEEGYVLTAAHVAGRPGRSVTFLLSDGRTLHGETLGTNVGVDAGLMKITDEGEWPFLEQRDLSELRPGDWCLAIGHPGGYRTDRPAVPRLGRIVSLNEMTVQTDCALVGGDSGGPLLDLQGRVIGVNSRIGASTAWNFHVPVSVYQEDWERFVAGESWSGKTLVGRAVLGVQGDDDDQGCKITGLAPGLPAQEAGLLVGDIIVLVDGKKVDGFQSLVEQILKKSPGDDVVVTLLRDGEEVQKTIKLTNR